MQLLLEAQPVLAIYNLLDADENLAGLAIHSLKVLDATLPAIQRKQPEIAVKREFLITYLGRIADPDYSMSANEDREFVVHARTIDPERVRVLALLPMLDIPEATI
jgi:hypothetical protein